MAPRGPAPPRPTLLDVLHLAPAAAEIGAALLRPRAGAGAAAAAADVGAARLACAQLRAAVDGSVKRLELSGEAALLERAADVFDARFPRLRTLELAPSPSVAELAFLMLARAFEAPLPALESIKLSAEPEEDALPATAAEVEARAASALDVLASLAAAAQAGRCPALAALDLDFCCDDAGVRALLGCAPLTRRLKRLALQSSALTCATAEALAAAAARGALPALASLRLSGSENIGGGARLDARALRALAAAPRWAALEEVDLFRVDASGDPDGTALVGFLSRAPRLRVVRWAVSAIADRGVLDEHCISQRQVRALLAEAAAWPGLETLELALQTPPEFDDGGAELCAALAAAAPRLPGLRTLRLYWLRLNAGGVEALSAVTWAALERLTLAHADLDDAAVGALCAAADRFPALCALQLPDCRLEDGQEAVAALLEAFGARLVELDLAGCGVDALALASLTMAALPLLETCDLSDNDLDDAAVRLLARTPPGRMPRLRALNLGQNFPVVSAAAIAFFEARAPAAFPELDVETGVSW